MKAWLHTLLDALLLRGSALARTSDRPDAFAHGLLAVVIVALLVGLPVLVQDIIRGFQPVAVVEPSEAQPDVTGPLTLVRPYFRDAGVPESIIDQIFQAAEGNMAMAGTIAAQIDALPTALPRPLARAFMAAGRWLSLPFAGSPFPLAAAALSTWLGYGVWVMLAAKLLGGRGTLHGFFGATGFFAVPHVLNIFSSIPIAGPLLGAIAFLWGLVIYTIATAVSHRLSGARALVAVFAPFILLLILVALVVLAIAAWGLAAGFANLR